ncbi:probable WRKY transcription factor 41 [Phalaenopsis equestris]|uniref:probable WRKY transcription factor 41 n=1 Tax=Phalaenopsis equestris TaxID=78828 RepID=UPI0009E4ED34|nr:probable WRKY transcription factor 41 [Phalaenopsis equestris]
MESSFVSCDLHMLINVLNQGNEHMGELQAQLDQPFAAETCKLLAAKAKSAVSAAISMARLLEPASQAPNSFDSLLSASDSPKSDGSDKAFKELERREMCKKRKTLPRWSSQVRACSSSSMDGPLDDGYSWRKYGQKDILGAKFPRSYYRCTYRHTHGCLATKQVQRSDDDITVFDVTYRGAHTCNQCQHRNPTPSPKEEKLETHQQQEMLLLEHLKTGLRVKTEIFNSDDQLPDSSPSFFSFPSTPANDMKPHNNLFSSASMPENLFMGNYSPTFVSSTASAESNYFSLSPCGVNKYGSGFNIQGFDSEIAGIISAATSTTNSPMVGMDFQLDQIEFETDFPFGLS